MVWNYAYMRPSLKGKVFRVNLKYEKRIFLIIKKNFPLYYS